MTRWTPDPTFYPSPRLAAKAPAETLAYVAAFAAATARPARRGRCRSRLAELCDDRGRRRHAECRRRAPPLRLERVQLLSLPERAASPHRAALPRCSGPALVPHPHHRHQVRSETAEHRAGDRAGGTDRSHRVLAAAHRALRARGHLRLALGNAKGETPGGVFLMDPETFDVLGRWEVERGPQRPATTPGGISATTRW